MEVIQKHWIIILKITFECQSLYVSQSLEPDLIRKLEEDQSSGCNIKETITEATDLGRGVLDVLVRVAGEADIGVLLVETVVLW